MDHYDQLDESGDQIRLLQVQRNADDKPIDCRMITIRFGQIAYHAISYTWGPSNLEMNIRINGVVRSVQRNCWQALWQVRHHLAKSRSSFCEHVWIDFLCINQNDLAEKAVQVASMGRIYRNASNVIACMGDPEQFEIPLRRTALEACNMDFEEEGGLATARKQLWEPRFTDYWTAGPICVFKRLANDSYWTRLWVVQELYSAKLLCDIIILHGVTWMTWKTLLGNIVQCYRSVESCLPKHGDKTFIVNLDHDFHRLYLGHPNLHPHKDQPRTPSTADWARELVQTIASWGTARCADGRDVVYALLPMIVRGESQYIAVDYRKDHTDLCIDIVKLIAMSNIKKRDHLISCLQNLATHLHIEGPLLTSRWRRTLHQDDHNHAKVITIPETKVRGFRQVAAGRSGELCVEITAYDYDHKAHVDHSATHYEAWLSSHPIKNLLMSSHSTHLQGLFKLFKEKRVFLVDESVEAGDYLVSVDVGTMEDSREVQYIGRQCRSGKKRLHLISHVIALFGPVRYRVNYGRLWTCNNHEHRLPDNYTNVMSLSIPPEHLLSALRFAELMPSSPEGLSLASAEISIDLPEEVPFMYTHDCHAESIRQKSNGEKESDHDEVLA